MKYFRFIKKINITPILDELKGAEPLWNFSRSNKIPVQRETKSIFLRVINKEEGLPTIDSHRTRALPIIKKFRKTYLILEKIAIDLDAELSMVNIVALSPRGRVYPHIDGGQYYKIRDRYHLVLKSDGSIMKIGDEKAVFEEGELWWFDNKTEHESFNESDFDRIHIIFDLLPLQLSSINRVKRSLLFYLTKSIINK